MAMDNFLITYSPLRSSSPPPSHALATYHSSASPRRHPTHYYDSTYYSSSGSSYYHPSRPRTYDDSTIIRVSHRSSESRSRRERERERERERRRHSIEMGTVDAMIDIMKARNSQKEWELAHPNPRFGCPLPPAFVPPPVAPTVLPPPPPPATYSLAPPPPTITYGPAPVNITYGAIGSGKTTEVPAWRYYGMSREVWERYWSWSTIANQWYHVHEDGRVEWLKK